MIGQQAIMDAYLCLLHLTAGILVGKIDLGRVFLFNLLYLKSVTVCAFNGFQWSYKRLLPPRVVNMNVTFGHCLPKLS